MLHIQTRYNKSAFAARFSELRASQDADGYRNGYTECLDEVSAAWTDYMRAQLPSDGHRNNKGKCNGRVMVRVRSLRGR